MTCMVHIGDEHGWFLQTKEAEVVEVWKTWNEVSTWNLKYIYMIYILFDSIFKYNYSEVKVYSRILYMQTSLSII